MSGDIMPVVPKHKMEKGDYFLMRAPDEDPHPIFISRIRKIIEKADGTRMVRCQDWLLQSTKEGKPDPIKGRYKVVDGHKRATLYKDLMLRDEQSGCFQVKLRCLKAGCNHTLSIHGFDRSLAAYWLFRYAGGKDSRVAPSEMITSGTRGLR